MLFLAGIEKMNADEQRQLLAQLQSFDSLLVIKEGAMGGTLKAKHWIAEKSAGLANRMGKEEWQERIQGLNDRSDWDVIGLQETVERNLAEMRGLTDFEVRAYLKEDIAKLVGLPRSSSLEEISQAYYAHMAKELRLLKWETMSPGVLEQKLYQRCLEEQIEIIKKRLSSLSQSEEQEIEEILQKEIESLSHSEQEAMRHATKLDELTGAAVLSLIKGTSAIAITQILMAGTGFGVYLFMSTMLKAFSLLLGMTFSFGVYTGASAALAFFLSPAFFFLFLISGGGILWWRTKSKLNDYLIKAVFMAGKAKLVCEE